MPSLTIRPERPEEFSTIYAFVKEAFSTARVSDGTEQDFVNSLRSGGNYIPELALVAEENGELAGHIMLTEIPLRLDDAEEEQPLTVLLLAPVSVRLESRDRGIGSALIHAAFERARAKGYKAVFLAGDPGYYGRFGFQEARTFGISHTPDSLPEQYTLGCELVPGALAGVKGTVAIV